ncbi:CsiV family protein [uncultured Pseudoteredinibacter sp.]|uniref:CsiV family protein n=1 Tax=uncultured Pseudoteredinibacter sp. TaxID=1641701 RepID=UPI00261AAFB1|nr:CsiV family protein [uncultured Pseudoteredinibacter sp.]
MKQHSIALASLFAAAISSISPISLAQAQEGGASAEPEHWYAVEVIAFKRLQINQNERPINLERLSLSYPSNSMSLVSAEIAAEMNSKLKAETTGSTETLAGTNTEAASSAADLEFTQSNSDELIDSPLVSKSLIPGAFLVATPKAEQELNPQAGSLARSRNQRVLFHHRWNLQLPPQQKKHNIAINGGERFGDHQELEGYIQLSRSRYLHIETNVWLSQFAMAQAEDFGRWLNLPKRPSPFEEVRLEEQPAETMGLSLNDSRETTESITATYTLANTSLSESKETPASNYVVNSIEQLQQKRRMRSGELHYIDHPAFGLLVKLSPIEAPIWPFDNSLLPAIPTNMEAEIKETDAKEKESTAPASTAKSGS